MFEEGRTANPSISKTKFTCPRTVEHIIQMTMQRNMSFRKESVIFFVVIQIIS